MSAPLIRLEAVGRVFRLGEGELRALDGVSFTIAAGEMVAITGASGSGKSTLMNLLGCLDRPDEGRCLIAGQDTARLGPEDLARLRRRRFGFVFQRYHLMPGLSAQENVETPALYGGMDPARRRARARDLLERLGLGDRRAHLPGRMSGGQQQRVAIARALMNGGEIILADEPTGALDAASGAAVMGILQELNRAGHTIVIVTHDLALAERAGRVIELREGRVVADRPGRGAADRAADRATGQITGQTTDRVTDPVTGRAPSGGERAQDRLGLLRAGANAARMALRAMAAQPLRAGLTMLGIAIGVAAVVAVAALGAGARLEMEEQLAEFGVATLEIYPGRDWGDETASRIRSLAPGDALALAAQPYVRSAVPVIQTTAQARRGAETLSVSVSGVGPDFLALRGRRLEAGRMFDAEAVEARAPEAVIDAVLAARLFPDGGALGATLTLDKAPVRVVGVAARSAQAGQTLELFMPHASVATRLTGSDRLGGIVVRLADGVDSARAEAAIAALMTARHGVRDFFVANNDQYRRAAEATLAAVALLISAVAGIALVVGGIGVMNIMLVSVSERVPEIGLRMAVGARPSDVMLQFLAEALALCLAGAGLGVGLALGAGRLLSRLAPMAFSSGAIAVAVLASAGIGLAFGFLPARAAARLDPADALSRS